MRKVEQIEADIKALPREEFAELRDWLLELDWNNWDAQIQSDMRVGKLCKLTKEAE